jgi:hypothetical protein
MNVCRTTSVRPKIAWDGEVIHIAACPAIIAEDEPAEPLKFVLDAVDLVKGILQTLEC